MGSTDAPKNIITRRPGCKYCFFEEILKPELRGADTMSRAPFEQGIDEETVKELCGKNQNVPCRMKDLIGRLEMDPFMIRQLKAMDIYKFDLGKIINPLITCHAVGMAWVQERLMGRKIKESLAGRYRFLHNLLARISRTGEEDDIVVTSRGLYELTVAGPETYTVLTRCFEFLKQDPITRQDRPTFDHEAIRRLKDFFSGKFDYLHALVSREDEEGEEEFIATSRGLYELAIAGEKTRELFTRGFNMLKQEYLMRRDYSTSLAKDSYFGPEGAFDMQSIKEIIAQCEEIKMMGNGN